MLCCRTIEGQSLYLLQSRQRGNLSRNVSRRASRTVQASKFSTTWALTMISCFRKRQSCDSALSYVLSARANAVFAPCVGKYELVVAVMRSPSLRLSPAPRVPRIVGPCTSSNILSLRSAADILGHRHVGDCCFSQVSFHPSSQAPRLTP